MLFLSSSGFSKDQIYIVLGKSDGTFQTPMADLDYFGHSASAGSWSSANLCPRELAYANGDGNPDIVGFASSGVPISLVYAGFNFA